MGAPFAASMVLGAAFAPDLAAAQATEDRRSISAELETQYDSNIARSSDARAALRGLEKGDVRVSPTLSIDISRGFGQSRATLSGVISYDFYAKNDQLNRERIALEGTLTSRVGPCTPSGSVSFSRRQSDLGDIAFVGGAPLIAVKNTETLQRYGAELACGDALGLSPFGGIEYERGDNSANIRERAAFDATRFSVGLRYNSPALGQFSLFASRRDVDLGGPRLAGDPGEYRQTSYGVGFSRDLGTRLKLSAQVSQSDVSSPVAGRGFSGLNWDLRMTALVGTRLRATASVGRQISNNLSSDATFVIRSPYSLRVMYAVNERVEANAGVQLTRQRFRYAVAPALVFIERDRREVYDAGLTYRLGQRLRLRVSGGHERRHADAAIFDYSNTFATAAIGIEL